MTATTFVAPLIIRLFFTFLSDPVPISLLPSFVVSVTVLVSVPCVVFNLTFSTVFDRGRSVGTSSTVRCSLLMTAGELRRSFVGPFLVEPYEDIVLRLRSD